MILAIGIDSFDTAFAGCTTHFSSLYIAALLSSGYELADYPWLVRLNPAIPWKTRGNGAIALHVYVDNKDDAAKALQLLRELARAYNISPKASYIAALFSYDDIREYLAERPQCLTSLYDRAVHEVIPRDLVHDCIRSMKSNIIDILGLDNRGIVGSVAALGMRLDDYTFELTMYRKIENWNKPREIDRDSVVRFDVATKPYTFLNIDYTIGKPLIAPHGYDPVLYAVRGEKPDILLKALTLIEPGEEPSHGILHRSNQATDAHLRRKNVDKVHPYDNPVVTGILRNPRWIPGGHLLLDLCDDTGCMTVAFYRETRWMRHYAASLTENYLVEVGGQVKPHRSTITLNAEYVEIRGCSKEPCMYTGPLTLRPPPSTFHHLMCPPERRAREKALTLTSPRIVFIQNQETLQTSN